MSVETTTALAAFLYGLLFGSFANVCIHRLPREKSIVWPGSSCPSCARPIRWFDNIPLFSWIVLGGRCRDCRHPISVRYPLVELLVGVLFAVAGFRHGGHLLEVFAEAAFCWIVVILVFTDFDHQILPDELTIGGTLLGLALSPWRIGLIDSAIGAAVGAGIPIAIYLGYMLIRRREGMGLGDVKMLAFIGAFLGWSATVLTLVLASFIGAIAGILLMLFRGGNLRRTALPFGVFLGPAALVPLYLGDRWIAWLWPGL